MKKVLNVKNRLAAIALAAVMMTGTVAGTFAYFSQKADLENVFSTKGYGTDIYEKFESPDDWRPGDTTEKAVFATNTGESDVIVRMSFTEDSWKSNKKGVSLENTLENQEDAAIKNFANPTDWTLDEDGYYYYNKILPAGETTSAFLGSVTMNPSIKLSSVATDKDGKTFADEEHDASAWDDNGSYIGWKDESGITHKTYMSTGLGYDDAQYTLTVHIETLQATKAAMTADWSYNLTTAGDAQKGADALFALLSK